MLAQVPCIDHVHLVVGDDPLAANRARRSIQEGAREVVLFGQREGLEARVKVVAEAFTVEDLCRYGRREVEGVADAVFVTNSPAAHDIAEACRRLRIPVNVANAPQLCTFTLLSTHTDGPLQIGVTTQGNGCRLANRIRREVASLLPAGLGEACRRLGEMRAEELGVDEEEGDLKGAGRRQSLAHMCEHWPLAKLCSLSTSDLHAALADFTPTLPPSNGASNGSSSGCGRIWLVGAGPGAPDLLTASAIAIIGSADVILADKLVPAQVLALASRNADTHIARKFPGHADEAQQELLDLGLRALRQGKRVVRLKQGDPFIYGRGGEEMEFFTAMRFPPSIVPGISSALCAPLCALIPPTHRAVADQVLICTATGRGGSSPDLPDYKASRTTIFLMALHRLSDLVQALHALKWPGVLPCSVIERATCPDQRVVRTTLQHVVEAVDAVGSRPPGLLVVGWACHVLADHGDARWAMEDRMP